MNYDALTAWGTVAGAAATLAAVLVALFLEPWRRWRSAPRLWLTWRNRDSTTERSDDNHHQVFVRLFVQNVGNGAAQRVEVVMSDVCQVFPGDALTMLPKFLPTALTWTHTESPICAYLPGRASRLICWKSRNTDNRLTTNLSTDHEYLVVYGASEHSRLEGRVIDRSDFQNPDDDSRGPYVTDPLTGKATAKQRRNLHYDITNPKTGDVYAPDPSRGWITDKDGFKGLLTENRIWWPPNPKTGNPRKKRFLSETQERMPASTFWADIKGQTGADELDTIMGQRVFAFPKSVEIIKRIVDYCAGKNSIVLDSFAGSGTTAHAVLSLNKEDGGNRKFILCQMPYETKEQEKSGENICDSITAERVRRVIRGVPKAEDENLRKGLGGMFSYFKLGKALRLRAILEGSDLPDYESLARYVFFTATGEEFDPKKMKRGSWFIGESRLYDVFLMYEPDADKLKALALTLDLARDLPSVSGKQKLVFAPTKYLDPYFLDSLRITFQQLPYQIYKALET